MLKQSKFTYEKFASLVGINLRTLYKYVEGTCFPSIEIIIKMADVLEISIDKFFVKKDLEKDKEKSA